jgi:hypothetical protein
MELPQKVKKSPVVVKIEPDSQKIVVQLPVVRLPMKKSG